MALMMLGLLQADSQIWRAPIESYRLLCSEQELDHMDSGRHKGSLLRKTELPKKWAKELEKKIRNSMHTVQG